MRGRFRKYGVTAQLTLVGVAEFQFFLVFFLILFYKETIIGTEVGPVKHVPERTKTKAC